jgi:tripartite-type tricarboxylate transporter receptor subunit TctC
MDLRRRRFLAAALGAAAATAPAPMARAQIYPARPVTIIVPFAAGGPTDLIGRMVAERMRASLGQAIIVENVSGADGTIGVGRAARARGDGYTLDLGAIATHVLNGAFYSLPYDVLNDFVPVAPLVTAPLILFTKKTVPAKDLNELIAWLKANPDKASAAIVSVSFHLVTAFFQKETGTSFALVPYRGTAPAMQDLVAGQIDLNFMPPDALALMRSGSIKAFAVTSEERLKAAPEIPTMAEMGLPAVSFSNWFALFAPKGTPADIIAKLNAAAIGALADRTVQSRLADLGYEVFPAGQQSSAALGRLVKADAEKWWPIVKAAGITGQ